MIAIVNKNKINNKFLPMISVVENKEQLKKSAKKQLMEEIINNPESLKAYKQIETYKIVTTVRGNSLKNLISKESPLGAAIFGHKVGDRCEVKVNDDYSYFVVIKRIENTTDDGSDVLKKF